MNWYKKFSQKEITSLDPYSLLQESINQLAQLGYKVQPDKIDITIDNISGQFGSVRSNELFDPEDPMAKEKKSKIHLNFNAIRDYAVGTYGNADPEALKQAIIDKLAEVLMHEGAGSEGDTTLGHYGDFLNALQDARKQKGIRGRSPFPGGEGVAENIEGKVRDRLHGMHSHLYQGKKHLQ